MNDAPLWSDTFEAGFYQATQWLDLCGKMGSNLNQTSFFCADTMDFTGFEILPNDVHPSLRAIIDLPLQQKT